MGLDYYVEIKRKNINGADYKSSREDYCYARKNWSLVELLTPGLEILERPVEVKVEDFKRVVDFLNECPYNFYQICDAIETLNLIQDYTEELIDNEVTTLDKVERTYDSFLEKYTDIVKAYDHWYAHHMPRVSTLGYEFDAYTLRSFIEDAYIVIDILTNDKELKAYAYASY